jgi:hypothetical protein
VKGSLRAGDEGAEALLPAIAVSQCEDTEEEKDSIPATEKENAAVSVGGD